MTPDKTTSHDGWETAANLLNRKALDEEIDMYRKIY